MLNADCNFWGWRLVGVCESNCNFVTARGAWFWEGANGCLVWCFGLI